MTASLDKAFGIHARAVVTRAHRAEILAANLVNADTPNYKARDFDFASALGEAKAAMSVQMKTTHKAHMSSATGVGAEAAVQYRVPLHASLDGNTVDAQVEQAEFADNALRYTTSLSFLDGKIKGLIRALREE